MRRKTRMTRIHTELDDFLTEVARKMSKESGRNVTKTDASLIIAIQQRQPTTIIRKKKNKYVIGGSLVSL